MSKCCKSISICVKERPRSGFYKLLHESSIVRNLDGVHVGNGIHASLMTEERAELSRFFKLLHEPSTVRYLDGVHVGIPLEWKTCNDAADD